MMGKEYKEKEYGELMVALDHCEKESEAEFEIYQRLVELGEKEIEALDDDLETDVINPNTGELLGRIPSFLDDFAAPMDNLSRIYIERKEYAKALPLLETILPIYRTLEIYNPNYTYQRCYALKAMVECLRELGKKRLAILYGYELKHLERDVLEAREKNYKDEQSMHRIKRLIDDLTKMGIRPFIGYGNPNADILIVGKECALKEDSEDWKKFYQHNFCQWKESLEGHGFGYKHAEEPYDFEHGNFHPINPFFRLENKKQSKNREIGRASSTYFYYQRLIDKVRSDNAEKYAPAPCIDFFNDCFITELNDICRRNDNGLGKDEHEEIERHIRARFDWMRKTNFFNQFKVVILACGPYADRIKEDETLRRDLFGDANVFYCHQLSRWDISLDTIIPEIRTILK